MRTSIEMNKRFFNFVWVFVLLTLSMLSGQLMLAQNAHTSWGMDLPFRVLDLAVNPRTNVAVVTDHDGRFVAVLDLNTRTILSLLEPGEGTRSAAIDSATNRAYLITGQGIAVLDLAKKQIVHRIPNLRVAGEETLLAGIALDERTHTAVVTHRSGAKGRRGFVSKIDLHRNTVLGTLEMGSASGPDRVAPSLSVVVNPLTGKAVVIDKPSKSVSLVDLSRMEVEATVELELSPVALAVNPHTNLAVVAVAEPGSQKGSLVLIDLAGERAEVVATIDVGFPPTALAVNARTNQAIVAGRGPEILVIDLSSGETVSTLAKWGGPVRALVLNPETNTLAFLTSENKLSLTPLSANQFVPAGGERVVYVVDEPEPGREDQFTSLPEAVAALCQSEDGGAVVINTARPLQVESLNLPCPVQVRSGEGVRGTLQGPGSRPLEVVGQGAVGLIGLSLSNGMQPIAVRSGGDAEVRACAIASPLQVQIGEAAAAAIAGGLPSKLRLLDNQIMLTELTVARLLDEITIFNNRPFGSSRPDLTVQGMKAAARIVEGSMVKLSENTDLNGIILKGLTLEANTEVEVGLNRLLGPLKLNVKEEGDAKYDIKKNKVSAEFNFELNGMGLPKITFDENDIGKDSFFGFSVEGADLTSSNSNFAEGLAMKLLSPLRSFKHKSDHVKVEGTWNITGEGLEASDVDLQLLDLPLVQQLELKLEDVSLNLLAQKVFLGGAELTLGQEGGTVGTFNVKFDRDSTVNGPFGGTLKSGTAKIESTSTIFNNAFAWEVEGGLEIKNGGGVVYNGQVDVKSRGVSGSVKVDSTGAVQFKGGVEIKGRFSAGVSAKFMGNQFTGVFLTFDFSPSGLDGDLFDLTQRVNDDQEAGAFSTGSASVARGSTALQDEPGEITISNNTFTGTAMLITDAMVPVKIENNTWEQGLIGGIEINANERPFNVNVKNNRLNSQLAAIGAKAPRPVGGQIVISDNRLNGNFSTIGAGGADTVRIEGNNLVGMGGIGVGGNIGRVRSASIARNTAPYIRVDAVNSCTIQGNSLSREIGVSKVYGPTCARVVGNTASSLNDCAPFGDGCLANDPGRGNNNIDPEEIESSIDFDGNGCRDYPPRCNERVDGRCPCDIEGPAGRPCTLP